MLATRVVHIRSGEPYDVYIGRKGRGAPKGTDGLFGNPTRDAAPDSYQDYLCFRAATDDAFYARLRALYGKTLACWCKPRDGSEHFGWCHGDFIAQYLELDRAQFPERYSR